jgi:hypothetical protein
VKKQIDMPLRPASPTKQRRKPVRVILKFSLLAAFLLLQVYLFFIKDFQVQDYWPCINQFPLPLSGENKDIRQEFRSPGPLARIDIMLANYKIKPESGALRLSIFKNNRRVFLKNYPANTVEDNRFYSFPTAPAKTPPLPAGSYTLQLDYFPGGANEKLAAWTSLEDRCPYGALSIGGQRKTGDLTFRVYYYSTLWQENRRWLFPPGQPRLRNYALAAGFLLLLFMVNLLFYYFENKLLNRE